MGTHCSSELYRGHIFKSKTTTMKLLLLTALAAVAMSVASWERGQLRLMQNLDIMDILMDLDITDTPIIMDTVLLDLESLDMLAVVPLLSPEALKVLASKTAISGLL